MPQVFQVLKCYKCSAFQIHQTKKSNKFECKMCGEKQSIKRHYGIGTGKDCRLHVQKLNSLRGEKDYISNSYGDDSDDKFIMNIPDEHAKPHISPSDPAKKSKWSAFVDQQEDVEKPCDDPEYIGDQQVLLEIPNKRKARRVPKGETRQTAKPVEDIVSYNNKRIKLEGAVSTTITDDDKKENLLVSNFEHIQNKPNAMCKILNSADIPNNNEIQDRNIQKQKSPGDSIFQEVSKSSKWAQFVNTEEENKYNEDFDTMNGDMNTLFSLCDDHDLDEVLDL